MIIKNARPSNPTTSGSRIASQEQAEELAIAILTWLSQQPELMNRFLAMSGIEAGSIRQAAQTPGFFGGLTGFLMNHEPTLMAFCEQTETRVEAVQACHWRFAAPDEGSTM